MIKYYSYEANDLDKTWPDKKIKMAEFWKTYLRENSDTPTITVIEPKKGDSMTNNQDQMDDKMTPYETVKEQPND